MFSLDEVFRSLAENGYGMGFVGNEPKKSYKYHFVLGNVCINVYNYNNTKIQIDGLQFKLDYNTMTVNVENVGTVDIHSLDELKHKVNEYRRVYKRMNETMKKLQIEKDFNE
jgi:hypothetical protein